MGIMESPSMENVGGSTTHNCSLACNDDENNTAWKDGVTVTVDGGGYVVTRRVAKAGSGKRVALSLEVGMRVICQWMDPKYHPFKVIEQRKVDASRTSEYGYCIHYTECGAGWIGKDDLLDIGSCCQGGGPCEICFTPMILPWRRELELWCAEAKEIGRDVYMILIMLCFMEESPNGSNIVSNFCLQRIRIPHGRSGRSTRTKLMVTFLDFRFSRNRRSPIQLLSLTRPSIRNLKTATPSGEKFSGNVGSLYKTTPEVLKRSY